MSDDFICESEDCPFEKPFIELTSELAEARRQLKFTGRDYSELRDSFDKHRENELRLEQENAHLTAQLSTVGKELDSTVEEVGKLQAQLAEVGPVSRVTISTLQSRLDRAEDLLKRSRRYPLGETVARRDRGLLPREEEMNTECPGCCDCANELRNAIRELRNDLRLDQRALHRIINETPAASDLSDAVKDLMLVRYMLDLDSEI